MSFRRPHLFATAALAAMLVGNVACNDSPQQAPSDAAALKRKGAQAAEPNACPAASYGTVPFRGASLSGAEWGSTYPGREGVDYVWAKTSEIDFFLAKGMNTFRIGFQWERLQPQAYGGFVDAYFAKLDGLVSYATSRGAHVVLNPHNFARYYDGVVGSNEVPNGVFADLWRRLAEAYAGNPLVMFNLVNEPHDMPTEQWVSAANDAIGSIRNAGAGNTIIVPGNAWTGGASWSDNWYGTPNAVAMLAISDPSDNVFFEAHQYLDDNAGGNVSACVSPTVGSERLSGFIDWLRANGKKGFLGEFAGGNNPTCDAAVKDMVDLVMRSSDVMQGFLWWAGGAWWSDDYIFRIEPLSNGSDAPPWRYLPQYLTDGTVCNAPPPPPPPVPPPPPEPPPGPPGPVTYVGTPETIVSNGSTRSYLLATPSPAGATPLPLVIALHGDGGSALSLRNDGPQIEAQANGGAIFAYLEAPDGGDTFTYWTATGRGVEAVFVSDLISSLTARGLVDPARVFLTGVSGGATMTNAIACVLGSDVLRGSVIMSGSLYPTDGQDLWATLPDGTDVRSCAKDPAVQIQWGQDDTGDTDFVTAGENTRDQHRAFLGCASSTQDAQPSPCVSYDGCSRPVGFCAIPGMGHAVWENAGAAAWTFISSVP